MEGERILQELKTDKRLENALERATNYLAPLFHAERPLRDEKTLSKLELFSLKLFKLSLERAKTAKSTPHTSIALCLLAKSALQVCAGNSGGKVPPLSFEKLLLHFAQLCVNRGALDSVAETCKLLRDRVRGREEDKAGGGGGEKEADTLLKHAFELGWKAALAVEQKAQRSDTLVKLDGNSGPVGGGGVADICLCLREEAFSCLLSTLEPNAAFAVERILRSSQRYRQSALAKTRGNSSETPLPSTHMQCVRRLHSFHASLLTICDLPSLLPLPTHAFLCVDYLCTLAKIAHASGHTHQSREYLARADGICNDLRVSSRKERRREKKMNDYDPMSALVHLTSVLIHLDVEDSVAEASLGTCLHSAASAMEGTASHCRDAARLQRVLEFSEEVFASLEKRRTMMKERESKEKGGGVPLVPPEDFPHIMSIVKSHVTLGEVRLDSKGGGVSEERAVRSAQLSALNLVTQILLSLLLLRSEEEYPAIETPRSSRVTPPPLTPSHPPQTHTGTTQTLAELCHPLLTQSQLVLRRTSSEEVLSDVEHRWLGNSGYNLGLALFRMDRVEEASRVFQLSAGELRRWCESEGGERGRATRWREAQLLKKTSLLIDCLRDSDRHDDVMDVLATTARDIPSTLLCEGGEGVEVMVEMWVRGKRELASRSPDSACFQQWRDRSLLSLLPPAHPPLSTRHRIHILTTEFFHCTNYRGRGSTNQNSAVGYELMEACREGGREWDVERGRVMVDMATTNSSLLDDALELLEGVVSGDHHTLTPSHHHRALLHLATAHTLKAVALLQERMGSCDVSASSHDAVTESHDRSCDTVTESRDRSHDTVTMSHDQGERLTREVDVCVVMTSDQRALLEDEGAEGHLSCAVRRWCELGAGGDGGEEGEGEKLFYFLRLTAELCSVTRQFDLAVESLGVLVKIYQRSPSTSLTAAYQSALAEYCQLGLQGGRGVGDFPWGVLRKSLLGAVREEGGGVRGRGGRGGSDGAASYLSCRLALASLYLHTKETDKCRTELIALFRDPLLSRHSVTTHTLTAGTRITTARLLQTRHTPILPLKQFLAHLLTTEQSLQSGGEGTCHLTAVELVTTAVKTLSSLCDHYGPRSKVSLLSRFGSKGEEDSDDLNSDLISWSTLARLLDGLLELSRLHLLQGSVREALYYAREGVSLARKMTLGAWYRTFVAVLAEIHCTRGDTEAAHTLLSISSPAPPHSSPPSHSTSQTEELHTAQKEANDHLDGRRPSCALSVCEEAIARGEELSSYSDAERDVALGGLHLTAGRAVMEEAALTRPVLLEELWKETGVGTRGRRRGRVGGGKKTTRVLGWLSLVPEPFQQALTHFCSALQYCHPTCPPHLLREVYQWLSVLLSPYHTALAAHCLLLSPHLSLSHHATTSLGKKIRKCCHRETRHPFHDVLITLQDSSEVCPNSNDPLVSACAVLRPPTSPPPLSVSLSLLSSLPNECQFTVVSLAPLISSQGGQEHLLLCAVGKNREPLFVKTQIEGQTMLKEFSATLSESEESMRLNEKRAWWGARRKLNRQIKEFVDDLQTKWLGDHADIFGPPPPTPEGTTAYHLLCVGRLVQHLPWEVIPVLRDQAVGRAPSLSFSVAHHIIHTAQMSGVVDSESGYYVLNPRGDLPATEKRFHGWFEEELGWRGVVGHAPSSTEFSEALQSHDVFVYCGHGTGREFLSTDSLQRLSCQATTLLMGCGSGRLVVGGACDPAGMAITYLLAGCPTLVAILWDVTDGDIDRLSKTLLERWLTGEGERVLSLSL